MVSLDEFTLEYEFHRFDSSIIVHADCFEWMGKIPSNSIHAIVTDPPYGVKEYNFDQIEKRATTTTKIYSTESEGA